MSTAVPELPDVETYLGALRRLAVGSRLAAIRLKSPFLLRSVEPPVAAVAGRRLLGLSRLGKRIVMALEGELFLVLHLMIAGRLAWKKVGAPLSARFALAAFDFEIGALVLTEAGSKKRASLYLVEGERALAAHAPPGIEVLESSLERFAAAIRSRNHTLKRALTDPSILAGIGNAYSDEILHRARLSPFKRSRDLDEAGMAGLFESARAVLSEWTSRLEQEAAQQKNGFPAKVTAFRPEMAVHGKHGKPCPECGAPVQRIAYAANEANYCARCQTGGKILADRALSRLLKNDWPRTLEELEERGL